MLAIEYSSRTNQKQYINPKKQEKIKKAIKIIKLN